MKSGGCLGLLEREFSSFAAPTAPHRRAVRPERQNHRHPDAAKPSTGTFRPTRTHLILLCLHFEPLRETAEPRIQHDWIDNATRGGGVVESFSGRI